MTFFESNSNVILVDQCQNLQNLTVTLKVTQDLVTLGNTGFSLQLNSYPQPGSQIQGQTLDWFQYIIDIVPSYNQGAGEPWDSYLSWEIKYWASGQPSPVLDEPRPLSSTPSNRILAGSVIQVQLHTDSSGNVTSATFGFTDPQGDVSFYTTKLPTSAAYPIYGFQVDVVGRSGTPCTFTSGAGTLTYSVSPGTLALQSAGTGCGGPQPGTPSTSNAVYSDIATVSQNLYVGQLLAYSDPGKRGEVSDRVTVGLGGWTDFKFLFAGINSPINSPGQGRIYAVNAQGQLLSYGDAGTPGNVSGPVIVGNDDWSQFKFLFAGINSPINSPGQNRIYGVNPQGKLLSYGDNGIAGNVSGPVIVSNGDWSDFKFLFAGTNVHGKNHIYAVTQQGELRAYRDEATSGNVNVSKFVPVGTDGWTQFKFLFAGANLQAQNCIYAVNPQGQLLSYSDQGTAGNVSGPTTVGNAGWSDFKFVFAGKNLDGLNRVYAVIG